MKLNHYSSMTLLFSYIVIILALFGSCCFGLKCPISEQDSSIRRLRSFLLCNYEPEERPVQDINIPVNISISLDLKHIFVNDATNQFEIHAWVTSIWYDCFLEWVPISYDGIDRIHIDHSHIWVPDVSIFNSDLTQIQVFSSTRCLVHFDGMVMCVPHLKTPAYCTQNLKKWPFDTQNCSLVLGTSWGLLNTEVSIDLLGKGWSTYDGVFEKNNAWELLKVSAKRHSLGNKNYFYLHYQFIIRRHATLQTVIVVAPAFILAGLVLISFWVRGMMCRACVCCVALIGDALFLQYIGGYHLPADGDTSPDIVAYYRDAMFLSLISLSLSVIVERLRENKTTNLAPEWVTRVATWLRGSGGKTGKFLLGDVEENIEVDAGGVENNEIILPAWSCYANFIERISFVAMFITHAIMLAALLP